MSVVNQRKPEVRPIEIEQPNEIKIPKPKVIKKGFTSTQAGLSKMKKVRSFDTLPSEKVNNVGKCSYVSNWKLIGSFTEDRLNEKLAKNRESARNSRKRKKIYIELLEKKIEQLQQELNSTKKQLEINTLTLDKATKHSQVV